MSNDHRAAIRTFIGDNFIVADDDFGDADSLLEKQILDSTGILELVAFLEERFEIKVTDDEVLPANLDSVDKICAFVGKKREDRMQALARDEKNVP